ncbi:MAG: hypothetical protein NTV52_25300 [Acidobacteria bacterium]|nr:hypothetical protein [Acidobacteriota bacterium]
MNEILRQITEPGPECLSPAQLERLAGQAEGRDPHVEQCAHCTTEIALLREFLAPKLTFAETAAVSQIERRLGKGGPSVRRVNWYRGAGVAAIAAAIAVGVWLQNPASRAVPAEDVVRSVSIGSIAPAGDLAVVPRLLRWDAVVAASHYRVAIVGVDREPLWQGESVGAELVLPAEAQALMAPGRNLWWRVSALDGEGRLVGVSGAQAFRYVPGGSR